ncbi:MAG: hypothetical protein A3E59_00365 [Candidatus Zambryskibacteria bacterium RIFCSPHIGHO2_12_FULL_39_47]|nr:MAG: hypothetical protein A3E59_00365 [Candidatus Zambryskibacteria bacterium RIFCSPHIGHO2_12_FULL_39_47]
MYQTEKSLFAEVRERGCHHFLNTNGTSKGFFARRLGGLDDRRTRKRKNGNRPIIGTFCSKNKS